jgi:hypothetical protein
MAESKHYTTQICLSGHVISPQLDNYPGVEEDYCSKCGAKTITACSKCQDPIRGVSRYADTNEYHRPAYCVKCGSPYPWTEAALKAAHDLAEELELSESETATLKATFPDLVSDSA